MCSISIHISKISRFTLFRGEKDILGGSCQVVESFSASVVQSSDNRFPCRFSGLLCHGLARLQFRKGAPCVPLGCLGTFYHDLCGGSDFLLRSQVSCKNYLGVFIAMTVVVFNTHNNTLTGPKNQLWYNFVTDLQFLQLLDNIWLSWYSDIAPGMGCVGERHLNPMIQDIQTNLRIPRRQPG